MFESEKFVEKAIAQVKEIIGDEKAIIALSGGVDSTTAGAMVHEAIGPNLLAVFVDTGLMRKGEADFVDEMLGEMGMNYKIVDASDEFFDALEGVEDPETKRKIIGEKFIRVFEREAKKTKANYLVQGTIAPDWIESGDELRDTIKSHHNVGGIPKDLSLELVEPLRELYKDEVRKLARHLDLPIAERQPFPGPGLGVRILGPVTREKADVIRECCAVVEEEIDAAAERGDMTKPWQYFAVLLPVRSVGVHGDVRAYGYTVVVRSVESLDAMSAQYSKIPHPVLEKISIRITNFLGKDVTRVVYDITHKPPGTIEWE